MAEVAGRVDVVPGDCILVLIVVLVVDTRLDGLASTAVHLLLHRHLLMILVALHEVGNAAGAAISQHLLARLRVLSHHLVLLLLLLQLVV